jgi:hypothetical protein
MHAEALKVRRNQQSTVKDSCRPKETEGAIHGPHAKQTGQGLWHRAITESFRTSLSSALSLGSVIMRRYQSIQLDTHDWLSIRA